MTRMRTVTLRGELGDLYGSEWTFAADRTRSVAEIVRALRANTDPSFGNHLMIAHTRGVAYRVVVGGKDISEDSLRSVEPIGSKDVEIVPVPMGAGGSGTIQIILGVLLVIVGSLTGQPALIGAGVALIVGGIVSLILAPSDPKEHDERIGSGFSGGSQVMQEGETIPVLFGEGLVTGQAVSVEIEAAADTDDRHQVMRILDVVSEGEIQGIIGAEEGPIDLAIGQLNFGVATQIGGVVGTIDVPELQTRHAVPRGLPSTLLDDVPASEFSNVRVVQSKGTSDQPPLDRFSQSRQVADVNLEMEWRNELVKAVPGEDVQTVRFNFSISRLVRTNKKGEQHPHGVAWHLTVTDESGFKIGKTESKFAIILARRNFSVELDVSEMTGQLTARVEKITPDSEGRRSRDITWNSIVAIGETRFSYPHVALAGIEFLSDEFTGIPERRYMARGLKVRIPSNYNPLARIYTGPWDGVFKTDRAYTNNPAWCLYEMLANPRFGLGQWLTEGDIDIWALYRAGVYCDTPTPTNDTRLRTDFDDFELALSKDALFNRVFPFGLFGNDISSGGSIDGEPSWRKPVENEPLAVFNAHMFSSDEAWSVIQDMCSAMFSMPVWTGNALSVIQDRDEQHVYEYNRDNVLGGNFEYSRTSLRERTNRIVASYNEAEELFHSKTVVQEVRSEVAKFGIRERKVEAIGATSRSQAARFARWMLLTEQLSSETISFRTGPETGGAPVVPGSIILVHDPHRGAGKIFGRTLAPSIAPNLDQLRLDREIELESGVHTIDIIMPSIVETQTLDRNETSIVLAGAIPNDDYRLVRVWVDTTGDGNPDTRREPNMWTALSKTLGLTPNNEIAVSSAYRIEYPQALHASDISLDGGIINSFQWQDSLLPAGGNGAWISTNQSQSAKGYAIQLTDTGVDPIFRSPGIPTQFEGSEYQYVRVRMRRVTAGGDWEGRFFWTTTDGAEGGFSSSRQASTPEPDWSDGWVTLTWDLSSDANWNARTITQFRFDFWSSGTTVSQIDKITADDGTDGARQNVEAGKRTVLTLATAPTSVIPETSVFIVTKPTTTKKKWRVVGVKESERHLYEVSAILHDPSKYAQITEGVSLEPPVIGMPTDTTGVRPPIPFGLTCIIQESIQDDRIVRDIVMTWSPPSPDAPGANAINGFEVTWQKTGNPPHVERVADNQFTISNAVFGEYKLTVRSVRFDNRMSAKVELLFRFTEDLVPEFNTRISGLEIEGQGNDTVFTSKDVTLVWRLNTVLFGDGGFSGEDDVEIEDGFADPLLQHFEVIVRDGITLQELRRDIVPKSLTKYTYTFDQNVQDGGPRRDLDFEVIPKDNLPVPRSGEGSSIRVSNPVPAVIDSSFLFLGSEFNFQLIRISGYTIERDHQVFIFWVSTTAGFNPLDPSEATAIVVNNDEAIQQVTPDTDYFWRVASADSFVVDPRNPAAWGDLNISVEISDKSLTDPGGGLTSPIGTIDIAIGAVTNIEQSRITVRKRDFFDGSSSDQGVWKMIDAQTLISRGGVVELAQMFSLEVVLARQNVDMLPFDEVLSSDYVLSVANSPRVKYRVTRSDNAEVPIPTITLIESGPMNLSAIGYFLGGFLSTKDAPPVGNFTYTTELQWMPDIYSIGETERTGEELDLFSGGPPLFHEFRGLNNRWYTFMLQTEMSKAQEGTTAPPVKPRIRNWFGLVRWRLGGEGNPWSDWWAATSWPDPLGLSPPFNSVDATVVDGITIAVEPAALASGQLPDVQASVEYELDLSLDSTDEILVLDILSSDMLVMEWSR